MSTYYIGVDGGGSKTQYALFDETRKMLGSVKTEGSNHENLPGSYAEAAGILLGGIERLLVMNALRQSDVSFVLMALAGMDHPYQEEALANELRKAGLQVPFSLYNDGYIVVKAGSPTGVGVGYNCGTGTCCNSIDADGKLLQFGGFGQLSGDVGGGRWIAAETFRMVYDDLCLGHMPTLCTKLLTERFSVPATHAGLLTLVHLYEEEDRDFIHDMIDVYFDALAEDDPAARAVAEVMADRGAAFIAAHIRKQRFVGSVEVVLSGSMHTKLLPDWYVALMKEKTEALSGRKCFFRRLTVPPVTGCINWILEGQKQ
ncbi:MAG: hypothetical protein IK104_03645 [Clostridia bacterium]|nr:hypothetical protein [Clostridia bacterium]